MPAKQPAVEKLTQLLKNNPELKSALTAAIKEADEKEIKTLSQFCNFLNGMLTHIPNAEQLNPSTEKFWIILNKAPNDIIKKSDVFNEWIREFMLSMGSYMDSTESAKDIESFIQDPKNKIEEYITPPSGY